MSHIAETWNELCANAERFQLDPEKFNVLSVFFKTLDPAVFHEFAAGTSSEFPMEKAKAMFPDEKLFKLLLLCVVANLDSMIEKYRIEQWPDSMLKGIIPDLKCWLDTLERDLGGYGLIPRIFYWCTGCIKGNVKSFGRLQGNSIHSYYGPCSVYRKSNGEMLYLPAFHRNNPPHPDLTTNDKVLNIHIPASGPLLRQDCIDSLKRMCDFSAEFQPDYDYKAIVCYSWLLDPVFQKILKPGSNIVEFQKLGHIFRWEGTSEDSEVRWRLWGNIGNQLPLEQLSTENSMKRAVVDYLRDHGHFCEGILVIFKDELPALFQH